jgi:hypothetical protein
VPRVAVILELRDNVVSHGVAFGFCQTLPQTAHDLDSAAEGERKPVSENIATGHFSLVRTDREQVKPLWIGAITGKTC